MSFPSLSTPRHIEPSRETSAPKRNIDTVLSDDSEKPSLPPPKRTKYASTATQLQMLGVKLPPMATASAELAEVITPELLRSVIDRRKSPEGMGKYVPGIPGTDPHYEARSITVLDPQTGKCITGAFDENGEIVADSAKLVKYSQQSMSKPVAEALAKNLIGISKFRKLVGADASGRPYNSDVTYPDRPGIPYNGNVNIGALKVWDILVSEANKQGKEPITMYMDFLKKMANNDSLTINQTMADGEFSFKPQDGGESNNMKLLAELQSKGNLQNSREEVYKAYCQACAVMITTEDSARIRSKFENGTDPASGEVLLAQDVAQHTLRSMTVSGMYDESGHDHANFGVKGAKSGVDGGIMFSLPSKIPGNPDLIVAVHHAGLNLRGNSAEGTKWMKDLSKMPLTFDDDLLLSQSQHIDKGEDESMQQLSAHSAPADTKPAPMSSQRDIDRELESRMLEGGRSRLANALEEKLGNRYKGDLYLKHPKGDNSLDGGTLLLAEQDKDGKMKHYYHVPDRHQIEKVVVVEPSTTSLS